MENKGPFDMSGLSEDCVSLLQYSFKLVRSPLELKQETENALDDLPFCPVDGLLRHDKLLIDNLQINNASKWKSGSLTNVIKNNPALYKPESFRSFISMHSITSFAKEDWKTGNPDQTTNHKNCNDNFQNDSALKSSSTIAPEPKRFKFQDKAKGPGSFLPPRRIDSNPHISSVNSNAQAGGFTTHLFPVNTDTTNKESNVHNRSGRSVNISSYSVNQMDESRTTSLSRGISGSSSISVTNSSQNQFKTAYEQLAIEDRAKGIKRTVSSTSTVHVPGLLRRAIKTESNNVPASKSDKDDDSISDNPEVVEIMKHDCMKNVDPKMVEAILNEVVEVAETKWEDIAGLEGVKNIIKEIIIWPMLRPDIFKGLRGPPKGILLFGPPGTGKTMIGRLISTQSMSTFFNISASSLTSKWIGDGEKMVRALFQVARVKQPAVIFIDEIDSILTQRGDTEHESSRRLKTEFLIQFDGCGTKSEDRILVIGVTNRPQELDEAARRRLVKRIYIPLPDLDGRQQLVRNLLQGQDYRLSDEDFQKIGQLTEGYSGADIRSICQEAAYGPIRDVGHMLQDITVDTMRPMQLKDFESALRHVKASVATSDLVVYEDWDEKFGCHISQPL